MVDDSSSASGRSRRQNCEKHPFWSWHKVKGEASLSCSSSSRGTIPSLNGILGSHLVTLVVNEVLSMKERILANYLRILSQGEDARPMIFYLVRIRGGYIAQGRALDPKPMLLSVPPVRNKITSWYRRVPTKRQWMRDRESLLIPFDCGPSNGFWNDSHPMWAVTIINCAKIVL